MGMFLASDIFQAALFDLSLSEQKVLQAIAIHADDTDDIDQNGVKGRKGGDAFFSQETLALECGLHKSVITRAIKILADHGWIKKSTGNKYKIHLYSSSGQRKINCYDINLGLLTRCLNFINTFNLLKEKGYFNDLNTTEVFQLFKKAGIAASSIQEGDWENKEWSKNYVPKIIEWDGKEESIRNIDWETFIENEFMINSRGMFIDENGDVV